MENKKKMASGKRADQKQRGSSQSGQQQPAPEQPGTSKATAKNWSSPPLLSLEEKKKYMASYKFPIDNSAFKYEKVDKIGQGTFGEVFKARERNNNSKFVAMKRVLIENETEGFPITALREIRILKLIKHENIVEFIEICRSYETASNSPTFYLIFEFCEHDLAGLLSNINVKFSLSEIKKVMQQLLNALYYIHNSKILHRDVKTANILVNKQGILKLADFGLARAFSKSKNETVSRFTNKVVTLWYRPPELLLGDCNYGTPVDMWGAGCIMAEMWTRSPILQGTSEQHQINCISQLCGSFTPDVWPGLEQLDLYKSLELPKTHKRRVTERLLPYIKDTMGCDLLEKLLTLDPKARIDANKALNHDFFWFDPMPSDLGEMLAQHSESMFEYLASTRRAGQLKHYKQQMATKQKKPEENSMFDRIW